MTIDEEGEYYVTSSVIVPRLVTAKRRIDQLISNAIDGRRSNGQIIDPQLVKTWKLPFEELWNGYLEEFVHDPLFLCATLLDPRNVCGKTLSWTVLKRGTAALKEKLSAKFEEFEEERISRTLAPVVPDLNSQDAVPGIRVATARAAAIGEDELSHAVVAAAFGAGRDHESSSQDHNGPSTLFHRTYNNVSDELRALFDAVRSSDMDGKWKRNPMDMYLNPALNIQIAKAVALDVLSVPAGEALSERVFQSLRVSLRQTDVACPQLMYLVLRL